MKTVSFIIILFFATNARAQSALEVQLRGFPIVNFLNKPVDTLIAHLPAGFDTTYIVGDAGNTNRGASLQINYPPNYQFWVHVFITDPQFITVNKSATTTAAAAWPVSLLRKEKIGRITIYTGAYQIINHGDIY